MAETEPSGEADPVVHELTVCSLGQYELAGHNEHTVNSWRVYPLSHSQSEMEPEALGEVENSGQLVHELVV